MTPIHVTGCRVFLTQNEDEHLKAFASIILNDVFAVCDLKVIQGKNSLFVAMPSRRRRDGTFHDVAHPINHMLRDHIEQIVLGEYEKVAAAQTQDLPRGTTGGVNGSCDGFISSNGEVAQTAGVSEELN